MERVNFMYKEQLLDYQSEKEYLLIRLLYLNDYKLSKKEICDKLNISYPTLKKTVDRTNDYFQIYFSQTDICLYTKTHEIEFSKIPELTIDEITYFFLKTSGKYILLDLLYKHPSLSRANIADQIHVSDTALNLLIIQCNELLNEFGLYIKKGNVEGPVSQYFYFYFLFYWGTGNSPIYNLTYLKNDTINYFLEEKYGKKIGIIEQKKIALWLVLLREKRRLLSIVNNSNLDKDELMYISSIKKTDLFGTLKQFFFNYWKELSDYETEQAAYLTFLFFNSFEILDNEIVNFVSLHTNDQRHLIISKIMVLLERDFQLNQKYHLTYNTLYFLLGKVIYFKGIIYSIDKITLDYYLNYYISDFEKSLVQRILYSDVLYINGYELSTSLYLKFGLYSLVFNLRKYKRNNVKVALLLNTSPILRNLFITKIEQLVHYNSAIQVVGYRIENEYDLIITNLNNLEKINAKHHYKITDLVNDEDFKNILSVIEYIEIEKTIRA